METILTQIIEADKAARKMAEEAKVERKKAQDEIKERKESVRKDYLARANEQIELLAKSKQEQTKEQLEAINKQFEGQMALLDKQYDTYGKEWINHIVSQVTEV